MRGFFGSRVGRSVTWVLLIVLAAVAILALWPELGVSAWRRVSYAQAGAVRGVIEVEDLRLSWAEVPAEAAPARGTVLLVHGLRGETTVLLPLARELSARGWRVICLDLPGHGLSALPPETFGIGDAARLVAEAARKLPLGPRPAVLGHSMGGWVVALAALEEPALFGKVILVSAAGMFVPPPSYPLLLPDNAADAKASLPLLLYRPPWVPRPILWIAARRPMETSLALMRSAASGDYLLDGLLSGMNPPALVVWGAEDRLLSPDAGRRMAAELPGGRFREIPEAGHMVVWEKPAEVAEEVSVFLGEAPSGGERGRDRPGASP